MKKIIIVLISLLIITGCSLNNSNENISYKENSIIYNLFIKDYYMESIDFYLPENAYDIAKNHTEVDYDSIEYMLLEDNFARPIHNNNKTFYQKTIKKLNNSVYVNLKFNYLENDFINSNYINTCFENKEIHNEEDYFEIHLSGAFYCLQDKTLTVQVTSSYVEEETNGEKNNNSFKWTIDKDNFNNVNIYYKVMRNKSKMIDTYEKIPVINNNKSNLLLIEFFVIVSVLLLGFVLYIFVVRKK